MFRTTLAILSCLAIFLLAEAVGDVTRHNTTGLRPTGRFSSATISPPREILPLCYSPSSFAGGGVPEEFDRSSSKEISEIVFTILRVVVSIERWISTPVRMGWIASNLCPVILQDHRFVGSIRADERSRFHVRLFPVRTIGWTVEGLSEVEDSRLAIGLGLRIWAGSVGSPHPSRNVCTVIDMGT